MDIFLVNQEDPSAESLSLKLADAKPNQTTPLTEKEMILFEGQDFKHLTYGNNGNQNIVEVNPGGSYIFVCDKKTNIDDIAKAAKRLRIDAAIIRIAK